MPVTATVVFTPRPQAAVRLYCLPYAGSGASVFRPWAGLLPADIELRAVQLPGHEGRRSQAPFADADRLVDALAEELAPEVAELPFAFFGHSMGGLCAFELTRRLRRLGVPSPVMLGVSAWPAPRKGRCFPQLHDLDDAQFMRVVEGLGGIPEEVLSKPCLSRFLLPTLRPDMRVCGTYRYQPGEPLDCPLMVFGGTRDPLVPPSRLDGWNAQTTGPTRTHIYPGHHFYLNTHLADLVRRVSEGVLRHIPAASLA